ncbi:MAG TPA: hypothetical protein VNS32_10040 [Flavisolibacter sp.]|nr:hypothetical protein [Flavisolibacter sp.]
MEKFNGFENWLKAKGYVSWRSYISFMRQIESTLLVKDFERITSVPLLKRLMVDLESNRAFQARGESDKGNILSGFKAYIQYIDETK